MAFPRIYTDENAARGHLESLLWPDGPICPHCGTIDQATRLQGKSTRPRLLNAALAWSLFVTLGIVFERSKMPLNEWVHASHLLTSSKKGISSHQLSRMLHVTYKTAWFMAHRIREAMRPKEFTPVGGAGQTVEIDETIIGFQEGVTKEAKRNRIGSQFRNVVLRPDGHRRLLAGWRYLGTLLRSSAPTSAAKAI